MRFRACLPSFQCVFFFSLFHFFYCNTVTAVTRHSDTSSTQHNLKKSSSSISVNWLAHTRSIMLITVCSTFKFHMAKALIGALLYCVSLSSSFVKTFEIRGSQTRQPWRARGPQCALHHALAVTRPTHKMPTSDRARGGIGMSAFPVLHALLHDN
jgi:hypothetical protein